MTLWGVRSGKYGERENLALEGAFAVIGWDELPDLSKVADRSALRALLFETYPEEKPKTITNWESQVWPAVIVGCLFSLAAAFGSDKAAAQSSISTCIAMGPDMLHCDTMNMEPQPSATAGPDGGAELGRGIARFITRTRERAFRQRVGKLLADGDCQGASRLALESGRLELGQSISATCRRPEPNATLAPPSNAQAEQPVHRY